MANGRKWSPQTPITRLSDDDVEVKASWVRHITLDKSCFPNAENIHPGSVSVDLRDFKRKLKKSR